MISSSVKFLLNDKLIVIKNPDPNQTLLNYIRTELKKTGTKEGCSEGGCGACTIVLGELVDNKIEYKAINSCISFVPTLNGKQLIIVEDLVSKNGQTSSSARCDGKISWFPMWFLHTRICYVFIFNV